MKQGSIFCLAVFCGLLLLSSTASAKQPEDLPRFILHNLHFQEFKANGFSAPGVTHSIHQDTRGRLWIGTEVGLFLYNGNQVRSFRYSENASEWIPNSFVKAISEDQNGRIWIGTWGGGIAYFDESSREFVQPDLNAANPDTISRYDRKVWSLDIDQQGHLWIGTFTSGLFRFDPDSSVIEKVYQPSGDEPQMRNRIDSVFVDSLNRVWFTPYRGGIRVLDTTDLTTALTLPETFHDGGFADISEFDDGRIITADYSDVFVLSQSGELLQKEHVTGNGSNNQIMEVLPYEEDSILIGTGGASLWYLNLKNRQSFRLPSGQHPGIIEPSIIWQMEKAGNGDLLVAGTIGAWFSPDISRQFWAIAGRVANEDFFFSETRAIERIADTLFLNSDSDIFKIELPKLPKHPSILDGRKFATLAGHRPLWLDQDFSGRLWIGTDNRVFHSDKNTGDLIAHPHLLGAHTLFRNDETKTLMGSTGYRLLPLGDELLSMAPKDIQELVASPNGTREVVQHMAKGLRGDIWTGGFTGISRYDAKSGQPLIALAENAEVEDWNDPYIAFIHPVSEDSLLLGGSNGIWLADLNKEGRIKNLKRIMNDRAFSSASFYAYSHLESSTYLFIGDPGIIEYDMNSDTVKSISVDDGYPNFNPYAAGFHEWDDGLLALSGTSGPLLFQPEKLRFPATRRKLIITDITSFRENEVKHWPLHEEPIEFRYPDRVIRFRFGLLDYINPMNDHYEIRLRGFNQQWLDIGRLKEFSFTNLDSGTYTFDIRVTEDLTGKVSTNSINFEMLPPWWQTWWAYTLYVILSIGSVVGYIYHLQRKLKREKVISEKLREADSLKGRFLSELEIKVDEATADMRHAVEALEVKNVELEIAQQRAQDASRLKSEFLANMSHEIRTPMNGVLGFTQLLKKSRLDNDQEEYVETLESSAHNLLGIINDILDLSKIEAGKLIIDNTGFNLRTCATETIETLTPVAYDKDLELALEIDADLPPGVRGDPVRIRQVVTNLIGNAIKFTDAGTVSVVLRPARLHGEEALEIRISDTGRGISAEDREKLFKAFERGQAELTASATGTGLGLVITKKLTEAMGGEIDLASEAGKGTRVTLRLPLKPDRNPENSYEAARPLLGKRIHLADGDEASRAALHEQLRFLGAEVLAKPALDNALIEQADVVAIGVTRENAADADEILGRAREQVGGNKPMLCFISRTDRSNLRELGERHHVLCLPKIAHLDAQVRRIEDWLRGGERPEGGTAGTLDTPKKMDGLEFVVADDNRINRFFLRKMLQSHGATVHEATNGREALRMLTDTSLKPDMALIDLHMPEMNGLELAEKARDAGVEIPLLVVSANVLQETRDAAQVAGFDDYILKPVEEPALLEAVQKYVQR